MKPGHKRIAAIAFGLLALGIAAALVLQALEKNLMSFFAAVEFRVGILAIC